ncbi:GNAT family N-acetyltransferase [Saccharibacillus brassicae]|uniref:GNAT family N-acetyltransferase n=1 Tax=Saccharibacillus brassicae TaxID=2583377 RepID=A0A4Y6US15_SACBS|nr:GNAT family N-acetyltransferase [Saccharibacillus brassicae]QDH20429.1 GNAT family N-acetyltransferase [Saccharibacillus brassicae]
MTLKRNEGRPKCPAFIFRKMNPDDADHLGQLDRSEKIEQICRIENGQEIWTPAGHECPTWNEAQLAELRLRYIGELERGGAAIGAYSGGMLAGFGVLGHRPLGSEGDMLQVDLLYVGRPYRRRGIGRRLMELLSREASLRGAKALYISSTESRSAVGFYRSFGSEIAAEPDPELFAREPLDIHLVRKL